MMVGHAQRVNWSLACAKRKWSGERHRTRSVLTEPNEMETSPFLCHLLYVGEMMSLVIVCARVINCEEVLYSKKFSLMQVFADLPSRPSEEISWFKFRTSARFSTSQRTRGHFSWFLFSRQLNYP